MRFILTLLMLGAIAWSAALAWFVMTIPGVSAPVTQKAQALVVLTGGMDRIGHALDMLAQKEAPILYISGVDGRVTEEQILNENTDAKLRERVYESGGEIVIDRVARSTVSNAEETAAFLKKRNITTIRLITANYHMRRALHEFHKAMPDVTVIPEPVAPREFHQDSWWADDIARRVIFGEFYKYGAVLLRDWLKPTQTPNDAS